MHLEGKKCLVVDIRSKSTNKLFFFFLARKKRDVGVRMERKLFFRQMNDIVNNLMAPISWTISTAIQFLILPLKIYNK